MAEKVIKKPVKKTTPKAKAKKPAAKTAAKTKTKTNAVKNKSAAKKAATKKTNIKKSVVSSSKPSTNQKSNSNQIRQSVSLTSTENSKNNEFLFIAGEEPHRERTREILKKHPEVKQFLGKKNPWSMAIILIGVAAQFAITWSMGIAGAWYWSLAAAVFVGAFLNHSFIALVHEASHNLIFKSPWLNKLAGILVNTPMVVPSSVSFAIYHMKHHSFQGVYELDADIPEKWEANLVKNIWYRKAIWLFLYPLFQIVRTARVKEVQFLNGWVVLNWLVVFAVDAAVIYFWGFNAFLYLFLSFWLGFGLHPVGARLIQEHYVLYPPQETYSYYGPLTYVSLHVGYHNEHHDFPSTSWNNLPKIKKAASEYYDSLHSHTSWTKLLFRFIFDKKISLFDRVTRHERGKIQLNAPVRPDLDLMSQS